MAASLPASRPSHPAPLYGLPARLQLPEPLTGKALKLSEFAQGAPALLLMVKLCTKYPEFFQHMQYCSSLV